MSGSWVGPFHLGSGLSARVTLRQRPSLPFPPYGGFGQVTSFRTVHCHWVQFGLMGTVWAKVKYRPLFQRAFAEALGFRCHKTVGSLMHVGRIQE